MQPIGITCIDYTADEMWTFYKKEHDGRMKERYHAIALMLEGKNAREVADALHLSRNTTWEWATAYNAMWIDGLKRKSPPGKKSCLTSDEKEILKADILVNPHELGYDFLVWDGKGVVHHIEKRFGKHIGVRWAQRLIKRLCFTRQRPELTAAKADPVKQEQFRADMKKRSTA
ncbi:MAG: transposase [Candidatus Sigynarchaeota archaeon]